ncbi:Kallikrein-8 [Smittium mucronatum]|uniref:Kallikrein-8 n=1 Tax=Smittium mucronatum TaxID=133383 RepID=A0A1R0H4E8_9FUNG|nr:Kallikrein-8 [Smittium mucronatum]
MKHIILLFLLLILKTVISKSYKKKYANSYKNDYHTDIKLSNNLKILNGTAANPSNFPYAVFIFTHLYGHNSSCTGSLIAEGTVLTAAHCLLTPFGKIPTSSMYVTIGNSLNILTEKRIYNVSNTIAHPEFSFETYENDIGIIKFEHDDLNPISLAKIYSYSINDDLQVIASGWGATSNEDFSPSDVLMSVPLQISSSESCSYFYPIWISNNDKLICTKILNGQSPCYGDSGGPLVYSGVFPMPLVGIISFGLSKPLNSSARRQSDCGLSGSFGFYTHVFNYIDWISKMIGIDESDLIYTGVPFNSSKPFSISKISPASSYRSFGVSMSVNVNFSSFSSYYISFYYPFVVFVLMISIINTI